MGCLDGASFTGRTGRYGQSLEIEGDEQNGAVHPIDAEVDDVGQDVIAPAIEVEPGVALDAFQLLLFNQLFSVPARRRCSWGPP